MQTTSLDVAQAAGLVIKHKGVRAWTCCPIHSEKTPSLCFFPDGRWHCFGCQAGGDAADMYAALHNVSLGEALRRVKHELPSQPAKGIHLKQKVDEWKSMRWQEAIMCLHVANAIMGSAPQANEVFWDAVASHAKAQDMLNLLESATPSQLLQMMRGIE
ncbi:MAG: hypothetical protein GX096_07985 [Clostridiales bacterium]|nr:hypothetical protein [Clostridiales bacterium]